MTKNLDIQYVTDNEGNKTAVLISIEDWELISTKIAELLQYHSLRNSLTTAFTEVEDLRKESSTQISLTDFLNECQNYYHRQFQERSKEIDQEVPIPERRTCRIIERIRGKSKKRDQNR
eukprot:TRINITY_DN77901_c0_g1_i1.p2 TRINITY_DN77901_c0_g1~~TRINITY_DN77901_c0_g1_i1.p2  ORF type:complete len:127 (-),score=10.55 TRINITY_DN77901_c0_g1_i1:44-400(-)